MLPRRKFFLLEKSARSLDLQQEVVPPAVSLVFPPRNADNSR